MILIDKIKNRLKTYRSRYFHKHYTAKIKREIANGSSEKRIYLFCNPVHPNLGDQAQTMCIMRWFRKHYPDHKVIAVPRQLTDDETFAILKEKVKPTNLLTIHSGYLTTEMYGYLPTMCRIVDMFPDNRIVIFPQTVNIATEEWQKRVAHSFDRHKDLTLLCRDEISFDKAKSLLKCKVVLYPDFVTSLIGNEEFNFGSDRDGVLFVIRDDKEKLYTDEEIDTLIKRFNADGIKVDKVDTTIDASPFTWVNNREKTIKRYLELFSRYQAVVTDRYHGTIFSQIVSTPTVVISSNDHKLKSGVKWFPTDEFGERLFYANDLDETYRTVKRIMANGQFDFCRSRFFEENYWSKLKQLTK